MVLANKVGSGVLCVGAGAAAAGRRAGFRFVGFRFVGFRFGSCDLGLGDLCLAASRRPPSSAPLPERNGYSKLQCGVGGWGLVVGFEVGSCGRWSLSRRPPERGG